MSLQAGARLGPYEILGALGAGGMGEVVRARDTRLDRVVALKILPGELRGDPERRRRFEREARAVASLTHPNIGALYDVGREADVDFLVLEYLEGETLSERLEAGPLADDFALRSAIEIARALEEAHRHGVVHRDLKPANIMLTRAGVKLFDFGIAKLRAGSGAEPGDATRTDLSGAPLTGRGETVGTLPYMAPEQVDGEEADARTDVFALGAVLYEMVTGKRAFAGKSGASLAADILAGEPPAMTTLRPGTPPGLERVVRTCLAKSPEDRFQTAREARLALEWVADGGAGSATRATLDPATHRSRRTRALMAVALALSALAGAWLALQVRHEPTASFRRLTFARGNVLQARFARDGETIVYSAAWEGRPAEVFQTRADGTGSRPLALPSADILGLSATGEMAVVLKRGSVAAPTGGGMLAVVPLVGGEPRELLDNVTRADWSPDGSALAVVHAVGGLSRIEYPIGTVLYETPFWIRSIRVSPDGGRVAFVENSRDLLSNLAVVDRHGAVQVLVRDWSDLLRVAWRGEEIVFGGGASRETRALHVVEASGRIRELLPAAGSNLHVHDIAPNGRMLVERGLAWHALAARGAGEERDKDLSWLGASFVQDLGSDGRTVLFTEDGEGGGPAGTVCLRRLDGSLPVQLGRGAALALSPDGGWALAVSRDAGRRLVLLPTGAGQPRPLDSGGVVPLASAAFLSQGSAVIFAGSERGRAARLWRLDVAGGALRAPRALTPEGVARGLATSPDGRFVATNGIDGGGLYSAGDGERSPVPGLEPPDDPIQWSADGRFLFLVRRGEVPARIERLELGTGRREPWRVLDPGDPRAVRIKSVAITRDGLTYAYSVDLVLASDLFAVDLR